MADAAAGIGDVASVARDDVEVELRHGLAGGLFATIIGAYSTLNATARLRWMASEASFPLAFPEVGAVGSVHFLDVLSGAAEGFIGMAAGCPSGQRPAASARSASCCALSASKASTSAPVEARTYAPPGRLARCSSAKRKR